MIDNITEYFSNMPTLHRTILLVSGLVLFSLIEVAAPLFDRKYPFWKHAGVNLFFTLTTAIVNMPLAFLLVMTCNYVVAEQVGLLQIVQWGFWLELIIGLMLLDFIGAWLVHYLEHKVKWMWRFHAIHHMDQNIDTTSGNRHHPGESVFRFVFTIIAALVVGAPIWMVFVYQTISVILTQYNHANFIMPKALDKILGYVIVTPNIHHVHHHYRMPYSDMNYGNIFSIWDRVFSTFKQVENHKLRYGLDTHMEHNDHSNIWNLLMSPFRPYRGRIEYDREEVL